MSTENVELTRAAFDRWQAGDMPGFAEFIHDDIVWDITQHPLPDFPPTGGGKEAFLANMAEYVSGWIDYRVVLLDGIEVGEEMVMELHEHARVRGTGIDLDRLVYIVWTVRERLFTRFRVYRTREEALAAV